MSLPIRKSQQEINTTCGNTNKVESLTEYKDTLLNSITVSNKVLKIIEKEIEKYRLGEYINKPFIIENIDYLVFIDRVIILPYLNIDINGKCTIKEFRIILQYRNINKSTVFRFIPVKGIYRFSDMTTTCVSIRDASSLKNRYDVDEIRIENIDNDIGNVPTHERKNLIDEIKSLSKIISKIKEVNDFDYPKAK